MFDSFEWVNAGTPAWLAAALAIATMAHLAVLLPRRAGVGRQLLLIALNALCVLALLAFFSPPAVIDSADEAVLLTPGATEPDARRAARAAAGYVLNGVQINDRDVRFVDTVPDLAALRRASPGLNKLVVLGAGLTEAQWREVGSWQIRYSPAPAPEGFTGVQWPRRLAAGQRLGVSGSVLLNVSAAATVHLVDPGGSVVATQRVSRTDDASTSQFYFDADIRAAGRLEFALRLDGAEGKTLARESLPVSVYHPPAVRVLMLFSSPSFESRYLLNWARQSGAIIAVRTAVSRARYRTAFHGLAPVNLQALHPSLLSSFDIIVCDARQWNSLSEQQRAVVSEAVHSSGVGLLVVVGAGGDGIEGPLPWPEHALAAEQALDVKLTDPGAIPTVANHAAGAMVDESSHALVRDLRGRPVAASKQFGDGIVALTFVTDSYALVTAGHGVAHARYWQTLIDGTIKHSPSLGFASAPDLPLVDWRLQFCVYGDGVGDSAVFDGSAVALVNQPLMPGQRCGYSWPSRPGWHRLEVAQHQRELFVFPATAWRTEQFVRRIADTQLAAQRQAALPIGAGRTARPLPAWWFFAAFLFLASLLWFEQKVGSAQ